MPNRFSRLLPHLRGGRPRHDRVTEEEPRVPVAAVALDDAPLESSPVLLPAAIVRQVVFDAAEQTPAWWTLRPSAATATASASAAVGDMAPLAVAPGDGATSGAAAPPDAGTPDAATPAAKPKAAKRAPRPKAAPATATPRTRSKRVAKTKGEA